MEYLKEVRIHLELKRKAEPDQQPYMKALKAPEEEAVMVGGHPIDVQASKGVGMKTIGVLAGRTKREESEKARADYILRYSSEICELL